MKKVKPNVNQALKSENILQLTLDAIVKDIRELEAVLSCYKHFQASYEASQMPEAYQQIESNKARVRRELSKLYAEHSQIVAVTIQPMLTEPKEVKMENYIASPLEELAMQAFYSDNRYTIKD